ncbi:MAG: FtsX-like permease family protein [Sarcina sp.]
MTFTSIIKKNFKFNFNKFLSFFLVNTAVIALMIMYSSLIFNDKLLNVAKGGGLERVILTGLGGLIAFCLVFITYTNIVFLKNRGKEFGMYLTLGMTTKELTKIVAFENFMVMLVSIFVGSISGVLFGRLFYMGISKVLQVGDIEYQLSVECFVLSIGVFVIIFLLNILFNFIYLKRVSVISILKSEKGKEVSKERPIMVFIALILFVGAMIIAPKALLSGKEELGVVVGIAIGITVIAPYILIGGGISLAKALIKKNPSLYNKNVLVISSLNYRFNSYKNMLYMLTVLVAGALFFVGYSYSTYKGTRVMIENNMNFDIDFDSTKKFNNITKEEAENIIRTNGGIIEEYHRIPYLESGVIFKEGGEYHYWSSGSAVVSESNYNLCVDKKLDLKGTQVIETSTHNELVERQPYDEYIFLPLSEEKIEEINKHFELSTGYSFDKESYEKILGNQPKFSAESYKEINSSEFGNYTVGYVVSDELYNKIKKEWQLEEEFFNFISGENLDKGYEALKTELREVNGLDETYWDGNNNFEDKQSWLKEMAMPNYIEAKVETAVKQNGMLYFILVFIGLLFLVANGVVLYYKVIADIDEEAQRIKSLETVGSTTKEIKSILSKEMAIVFFVPIFMGGLMGYYYLMLMSSNIGDETLKSVMVSGFLAVLLMGVIIQIIFYLISRRKYFKEIFRIK